jgi:hypothetical protein
MSKKVNQHQQINIHHAVLTDTNKNNLRVSTHELKSGFLVPSVCFCFYTEEILSNMQLRESTIHRYMSVAAPRVLWSFNNRHFLKITFYVLHPVTLGSNLRV